MTDDEHFRIFLQELCKALGVKLAGFVSSGIDRLERRLGVKLPQSLRDYYELVGRTKLAAKSSQRLYGPNQVMINDGHLVYMVEEQGVCFYGIAESELESNDPQVFQGDFDSDEWYLFSRSLRAHLATTLCWNCIYVSESGGQSEISDSQFHSLLEDFPRLPFRSEPALPKDPIVLWSDKTIIMGFPKDDRYNIYFRAGSDRELEKFETKYSIGIDWF